MYSKYLRLTMNTALTCTRKSILYSTIPEAFSSQCKRSVRKWQCLKFQRSYLHTTQKLYYPMPLTLCIGSILCGCYVRRWWLNLTPRKQAWYIKWYRQRRYFFYGSLGFLSFISIIYCLTRVKRDPVLNKPRLMLFDQTQQLRNTEDLLNVIIQNEQNVVPFSNPAYIKVARVIRKLTSCNKKIFKHTDWNVTIIHRMFNIASIPNVLILPDRNIIILYDIFNFIKSNDQLTFILAHEMSHEILLHTSETLSVGMIKDIATVLFSFLIWVFYSRRTAAILCSSMYVLFSALFSWYKRLNEMEADELGLELAAKCCVDIREILVFWEIMKKFEELSGQKYFQIPLLMQHPSLEAREKKTVEFRLKASKLRMEAKCPKLPTKDPRDNLPYYLKDIEKYMRKKQIILGMRL